MGNFKEFADRLFGGEKKKTVNVPEKNGPRTVNLQFPSGQIVEDVPCEAIDSYLMLVEDGSEDFLILESDSGFLQFYGVNNQFVAEIRENLPDGDFRTFSIIDREKEALLERISLDTPYGHFTPTNREVISLEQIVSVVRKYYENSRTEELLKKIPCVETTEETKRYMAF